MFALKTGKSTSKLQTILYGNERRMRRKYIIKKLHGKERKELTRKKL